MQPRSMPACVAVTGATGFVGRHVVRALLDRGCMVRALVRNREKARASLPESAALNWVFGDALDRPSLVDLTRGAQAIVHTIGIRRELPPEVTYARAHPQATRAILEAANAAGARRFIHISALGTRPDAPTAYHRTKFEAEALVRASGLDWTILRPSLVHGPGGELVGMIRDWVLGRAMPWFILPWFARVESTPGFPPRPRMISARVQPIAVDDLAGAVVAALATPRATGEVYHLGGPETLTWPELLTAVRDALPMTDARKRPRPMPGKLGHALALLAGALGIGRLLPFGPSEPILAMEDSVCAMDKARTDLGVEPRSFRAALASYAPEL